MNIRVEEEIKEEKYILQVGDVVRFDDHFCVVIKEDSKYILRYLTDKYGATGTHSSLRSLTDSLEDFDSTKVTIFPKSEYELVLRKIR